MHNVYLLMMIPEKPPESTPFGRWLHVFALSGFVIAQPLYDLLSKSPEVFLVRKSGPWEILILCLALSVLLPTGLFLPEEIVRLCWRALAWPVHLAALLLLALLGAFPALRQIGLPAMLALLGAGALSATFAAAYHRFPAARTFVTYLSAGGALFPLVFLVFSPTLRLVLGREIPSGHEPPKLPGPVVMVVFDEFPLVSLLDADHQVDSVRYPNFARLARISTWYPNGLTPSGSTPTSVATILTGRKVSYGTLPIYSVLPENLFTLMAESGPIFASEAATTLCPPWLNRAGPSPGETLVRRALSLTQGLRIAYLGWVLPPQWRTWLPPIANNWAQFVVNQEEALSYRERALAFGRFVEEIGTVNPGIHFIHTFLPHLPWAYLPDGRAYAPRPWDTPGFDLATDRWSSDQWLVDQGYRRHLLQVGLVDTLIGDLLDRLESLRLLDASLIVVTADHGCNFLPGQYRRQLVEGHSLDILNIPLFIKAPGQSAGIMDSAEMSTVNILPTIAQILGYGALWRTDGIPPSRGADRPDWPPTDWPGRSSLRHKLSLFGSGSRDLPRTGFRPDLIGRSASELGLRAVQLEVRLSSRELLENVDLSADFLPLHLRGTLRPLPESTPDLVAFAVNARICSVTRPFEQRGDEGSFSVLLSPQDLRDGRNEVEALLIPRDFE